MILLCLDESTLMGIVRWLAEQGYVNDEDYIWYRASGRDDQYVIMCYDPKLETLLSLKYGC